MHEKRELEVFIAVPAGADRVAALGAGERNLKMVREALGVNVSARDGQIRIAGERDAVFAARTVLERAITAADAKRSLSRAEVLELINEEAARHRSGPAWALGGPPPGQATSDPTAVRELGEGLPAWEGELTVRAAGRPIRPKTERQEAYLEGMRTRDLVFGIGPAGTGKTYLAVAVAVHLLRIDRVRKIVLARPAVEAGEKLGFLPGDMQEKVNPYLRPLLDALQSMMEFDQVQRFLANGLIEVVPLAFMRGRTLNDAVIILDEAQNATRSQMLMFLTRLGNASKMIVTGDPSQIDLADISDSGLIDAIRRLQRVRGVATVALGAQDIVRHDLVQRIVAAYHPDGNEQRQPVTDPTPYV